MERDNRANRYTPETRERAVRMVFDNLGNYPDRSTAIRAIAPKIGCSRESLRRWVSQAETDGGVREGVTTEERSRIKELEQDFEKFEGVCEKVTSQSLRVHNQTLEALDKYHCEEARLMRDREYQERYCDALRRDLEEVVKQEEEWQEHNEHLEHVASCVRQSEIEKSTRYVRVMTLRSSCNCSFLVVNFSVKWESDAMRWCEMIDVACGTPPIAGALRCTRSVRRRTLRLERRWRPMRRRSTWRSSRR